MTIGKCQVTKRDSRIKVEQNSRKAIFLNPARVDHIVTQVDGCALKNQLAADFVVSKSGVGCIAIELKGKDVDHAAKQVLATADHFKANALGIVVKAGLIVCTQYPRITTTIQRIRSTFARAHRGPIHVVTRNAEFEFERVLAFDGPK